MKELTNEEIVNPLDELDETGISTSKEDELKPYITGFETYIRYKLSKGERSCIGCFCRQKRLNSLYGVLHVKSGVVFMVGSSCVIPFNLSPDASFGDNVKELPIYLRSRRKIFAQ